MTTTTATGSALESLGIKGVDSATWYVRDLERARRFYTQQLDFAEVGESDEALSARGKQKAVVFQAGQVRLVCCTPTGEGGRAARWLAKHPEGVGTLTFEVEDVDRTFRLLEARGGTVIDDDVQRFDDGRGGKLAYFSITTPFGNTTFRFLQRDGYQGLYPGFLRHATPRGGDNRYGFVAVDHITSNFRTMAPMVLWMKHVLGFEEFWNIAFHTEEEIARGAVHGTGLKSTVMWDPRSQVKFANNEPARPRFKQSQINVFVEDQRGEGVQHLALAVKDIVAAVGQLRATAGIDFLHTPDAYYDYLPERLKTSGILRIDESIEDLRRLRILIDGAKEHSYLLQIFMKEAGQLFQDPQAGPFFYEVIQRKGDRGFGGGNFKALFESIERAQVAEKARLAQAGEAAR